MIVRSKLLPWMGALALGLSFSSAGCKDDAAPADVVDEDLPEEEDPDEQAGECETGPGRVGLQRLTRAEYNRTVRDLFGVTSAPADSFPPDSSTGGFDNNAESLTISPQLASLLLDAAETVATEAMANDAGQIIECDPADDSECARDTLRALALRVYRRPPTEPELDDLLVLVDFAETEGDTFEEGIGYALQAMLMAPQFLYRSVPPNSMNLLNEGEVVALSDYAMATRLSYFLWGSTPDDELLARAGEGALQDPEGLRAEFDRMLADPRAEALYDSFFVQWMQLGKLASASPDPDMFPTFGEALRDEMMEETRLFWEDLRQRDGSVLELVTGTRTFANEELARIYGVDGVTGSELQPIETDPDQRAGLLTMPAILTMNSDSDKTNIVRRGVWVAEALLCASPPPPPEGIPAAPEPMPGETERQRLERHRSDPACASCHTLIDPLGFGLEHYDALGYWRDDDNGEAIDDLGELPDGSTFEGAVQLAQTLTEGEDYADVRDRETDDLCAGTHHQRARDLCDLGHRPGQRHTGFQALRPPLGRGPERRLRNGDRGMNTKRNSKPSLSRRNFLRAAGVGICLPALPSLLPRRARAGGAGPIKRFVSLFHPNGTTMRQDWQLGGSGSNYTMGTAHTSLLPLQSKISMFKSLNGQYGGAPDHSRGTAEFLTGAPISNQTTPEIDISIDQVIADSLDPATPIRSLHLGPTPYASPPSDTGWPSGYNTYISWSSPTAPNAPLESAQVAFDQIFVPSGSDPGMAEKRLRLKQSILDHTLDQIDTITPRLGADDSQRLDEYLTSVREVETQLQNGGNTMPGCADEAVQPASGLDFPEHTRAMLDVLVLALRCDATRIATYSMDYGFGNKSFSFLGMGSYKHHNIGHSGGSQDLIDANKAIVAWYMDQIAYFLGQLDAIDEGGSSILDNSVVYTGSDVADAWSHSHSDMPMMLAGGGAGALNPGRLIDASGQSYDSVLLALAHAMDAPVASFSGASNPFSGL